MAHGLLVLILLTMLASSSCRSSVSYSMGYCTAFGLGIILHEVDDEDLVHYDSDPSNERINKRRNRIINKELPIDECLTRDCIELLQAMFSKNPAERPSLAASETFPWFSGSGLLRISSLNVPFPRPLRTLGVENKYLI